ncbi:putative ATP-dependent DNA helicase HFM1 [Bienertia sinuspersici]
MHPNPTKRQELWQELSEFAASNNKTWLIAGDFNETRVRCERSSSCDATTRRSQNFNEWIEDLELIETKFSGPIHTWERGHSKETRRSARLDRALCNAEWGINFNVAKMKHLPALHSDHYPILISPNGFGPMLAITRPFKFQAAWLNHEQFQDFLCDKWNSYSMELTPFSRN